jgi:hypothetical protein
MVTPTDRWMRLFDGETLEGWTSVSDCSEGGRNDWRTVEIIADGPKVTHMINGKS